MGWQHFLIGKKKKMRVICATPQLSVKTIPLLASEAPDRVVAMRVRPAIAGSGAARTPLEAPSSLSSTQFAKCESHSSMSRHPRFACQLWNPSWHSQLKEPTELMQLVCSPHTWQYQPLSVNKKGEEIICTSSLLKSPRSSLHSSTSAQ